MARFACFLLWENLAMISLYSTYLFGSGEQQQQAAAFIRCRLITQTQNHYGRRDVEHCFKW